MQTKRILSSLKYDYRLWRVDLHRTASLQSRVFYMAANNSRAVLKLVVVFHSFVFKGQLSSDDSKLVRRLSLGQTGSQGYFKS